jgi:DNA polymerase-3 subunit alpha
MQKADYIQDPRYAENNPQTMQRLDKQSSLKERQMGNKSGRSRQKFPNE